MQLTCAVCQRVLEFSGEAPRFCGYCGKPLPPMKAVSTALYEAEAVTRPPSRVAPEAPTLGQDTKPEQPGFCDSPDPVTVGQYRLLRVLGGGGMGRVYEAEHSGSGRRVALKLIAAEFAQSRHTVERFRQEGRLASGIAHPRCVFVLEADEDAGRPYIVMELMPGDTLQDLVQRQGPLPVQQAIARILDVIDGLREAHRLGVIHRDVKPSNCFLEADERVKIGDFGLSKSLMTDAHLTRTGTFLGTPLYASPEQVRGEHVDAQSDVYSVAATLYFLLTGRAPFQSGDMAATLARIVSDDPPSVRSVRPELPPSLDRILQRGLARQRERRYRDLEELRLALLPLIEEKLTVGAVSIRLGAYILDSLILVLLNLPLTIGMAQKTTAPDWHNPGVAGLASLAAGALIWVLYFGLQEGLWGCSLGKRLLGLRVALAKDVEPPGFLRAGLRALIVNVVLSLSNFISVGFGVLMLPETITQAEMMEPRYLVLMMVFAWMPLIVFILGVLLLTWPMRASNGYRMLHDWATGTRVIRLPERVPRRQLKLPPLDALLGPAARTDLGPYAIQGSLQETPERSVLVGLDPGLDRRVWIELRPREAPALSPVRRDLSRPTRLRWLACGVEGNQQWDAFLCVSGCPLPRAMEEGKKLAWQDAQPLLGQLTDELAAALTDGTVPARLTTEQVWVQQDGRLVLLDNPLSSAPSEPGAVPGDVEALRLVGQAAVLALEGRPRPRDKVQGPLRAVLPIHARTLLDPLLGVGKPYRCVADLGAWLRATEMKPAAVSRLRRAAQLLIMSLCAVVSGLGFVLATPMIFVLTLGMLVSEHLVGLERVMQDYERIQAVELVASTATAQDPATAIALAEGLPHDHWLSLSMKQSSDRLEALRRALRETAGPVTGIYLDIFDQQAQYRKKMLAGFRPRLDVRDIAPGKLKEANELQAEAGVKGPRVVLVFALTWPVLAVLWGGIFRGGLSHYFLGMALVRRDGRFAGMLRCAWRGFLVWLPITLCFLSSGLTIAWYWSHWEPGDVNAWVRWLSEGLWYLGCCLLVLWFVLGLLYPRRGPHDWLAGTYLVPR